MTFITRFAWGGFVFCLGLFLVQVAFGAPEKMHRSGPEGNGGYTLTETWSVGGPDADDPAQFYERLGSVSFDADGQGRLYVLDNGNHRVQVFDNNGRFLRSIGSEGEGPGEFTFARDISVNASGQVAVFDMGTARISIFENNGKLLRDQIVQGQVKEMSLLDDGTLVCSVSNRSELVAFDKNGDVIWEYGKVEPKMNVREINIEGAYQTVASRLVMQGHQPLLASGGAYGVTAYQDGEPVAEWSRPFERRAVELPDMSADEEDGGPVVVMIQRDEGSGGHGGGTSNTRSWSSSDGDGETMTFDLDDLQNMVPKHAPDLRGLLAWPDGNTWVVTGEGEDDEMIVDEWSEDGRYLRRFSIPRYSWLTVGGEGILYGLTHDEDDYPIVHRISVEAVS